jgi:hypothetical protein
MPPQASNATWTVAHPDRAQCGVQRDDLGCEAGDDERLAAARGERRYSGALPPSGTTLNVIGSWRIEATLASTPEEAA